MTCMCLSAEDTITKDLGPNGGRLTPVNTKFLETPHMDSEKIGMQNTWQGTL